MKRGRIHKILSILLAMALCLSLLLATAMAVVNDYTTSTENDVTTYHINGADASYITCTGDTVIDVTGLSSVSGTAKLYVRAEAEDCTITLKGEADTTYSVNVTFGYNKTSPTLQNEGVGKVPAKIILDNFRTSGEIIFDYFDYTTPNTESSLCIEYRGTTGANRIQGGNTSGQNPVDLTLTPATEGAVLNTAYLYANRNLTLNGGTILLSKTSNIYSVYVMGKLIIKDCSLTMASGGGTIYANNVVVNDSKLSNVKDIYAVYSTLIYSDADGNMYNSSIEIKNSSILGLTGGIYNAKEITIENSTVNYTGSPRDIRLGKLFLTLNIRDSTVTGATTSNTDYPAIGVDSWSWYYWSGRNGSQRPVITIDNSTVSATGGQYGPAIGRGEVYDNNPAVTINIQNGSNVTAIAQQGAGIGSGAILADKTDDALGITITDSTVRASSVSGAGIGSGFSRVDIDVPTNVSISGNSDVTAVSEFGAGIGAGQKGSNAPSGGIPLEFGGSGDWDDGADQSGTTGLQSLSLFALAAASRSAAAGLAENNGTLTISSNSSGDTPKIYAESGVKAVSLTVSTDTPMMEYTLANSEEAPDVTTPINRAAAGSGTDNGPGAPSYALRPGFRSLAFWPVAVGSYTLSYGSGSDPDPLLDVDNSYSDTYTLTDPASESDALAAYTVVRQQKLGGSVTLSANGQEITSGTSTTNTALTTVLTDLTPSGITVDNVIYQWYKDGVAIKDANSADYTPTDAGVYFCAVTGTGLYRGTMNSQAVTVATTLDDVPAAPTAQDDNITASSITLDNAGENYQYSIDGGNTWQDSTTFSGLDRNTEYSFVQRAGDSGAISAAASFTTKPGKPSKADLQINYVDETFTVTTGVSMYTDESCTTPITVDVNAKITSYIGMTVYLKYDDATVADDTTVTAVSIKDRPNAPTLTAGMVSAARDSLSLQSVSGVTYALFNTADTETPLQTINGDGSTITFNGLNPNTTYVLKAREEATNTDFHSYQARLTVSTSDNLTTISVMPGKNSYLYNGKPHTFVFTTIPADIGKESFTVKYYAATGNSDDATADAPAETGTYSVIVTREADDTYAKYEHTFESALTITGVVGVTVTLDPNGGTLAGSTDTVMPGLDGKLTSLPAAPTRSGYTFDDWYTTSSGGKEVTTSTVFTEDTTIYAHWTPNSSSGTGKAVQIGASQIKGGQTSSVCFGNYYQSDANGNTKDPIKWRVLSNADGKLFLLADQNLDVQPYNTSQTSITWEKSTIRSWLNGYGANENNYGTDYSSDNFIDTAFSDGEQGAIAQTHVDNADNPTDNTPGGNDTTDKIFLLSIGEASNSSYFPDGDNSRMSTNNDYVASRNNSMSGAGAEDAWWLRSPGTSDSTAADVKDSGDLNYGHNVAFTFIAVRPAFHLNLDSVLFTSAADNSGHISFGTAIPDYGGNKWKVTLKDNNDFSSGASVSGTTSLMAGYSNATLTISHTALSSLSGDYTDVTAALTDTSGNLLYYGSINSDTSATESTVTIPAGLSAGTYVLSIYGEDWNEAKCTDYATGTPYTVTLTIQPATGGGGGVSTYAVAVEDASHGSVKADRTRAASGTTVTITVTPDGGYELDALTVTDSRGNELKLTDKGGGKYTFRMPASKVTVEASFAKIEEAAILVNPFTDVSASAYYYDAVLWAVENGITGGTTPTTFSPNAACTRAQAVTFLWRAAGSPRAASSNPFTDVPASAYYYDAVVWAVENGITGGTTPTTFSPNAPCTRAQIVTFLYRAGGTVTSGSSPFTDVANSAYYYGAVLWAVKNGVTAGTSATTFSPNDPCTRAQIVTFLYRANV